MGRLDQRVALVTGGASGIGKAIAQRLATEGAIIVITDLDAGLGQKTATDGGLTFLTQDVSQETRWNEVIDEVERRCGRLDILVNNAGIVGPRDAVNPEDSRFDDWKQVFAVNVDSVFLGCRAAIPAMRRTGSGSIINIASIAALQATPYGTAYGASKAAVMQLTRSVAQHCAEQGLAIRCNAVHPSNVHTPLWDEIAAEAAHGRAVRAEDILDEARARNPMGAFTLPEDVAASVAFLASDDARRITGSAILVDGGSATCDTFHLSNRYLDAVCGSRVHSKVMS